MSVWQSVFNGLSSNFRIRWLIWIDVIYFDLHSVHCQQKYWENMFWVWRSSAKDFWLVDTGKCIDHCQNSKRPLRSQRQKILKKRQNFVPSVDFFVINSTFFQYQLCMSTSFFSELPPSNHPLHKSLVSTYFFNRAEV